MIDSRHPLPPAADFSPGVPAGAQPPRLLAQVRRACRARQFSDRTADGYAAWVRRFARFHDMRHPARPHRQQRLPIVLSRGEVRAVLDQLTGVRQLVASLLYGSGLRLMETLQLRIKDVDLERREVSLSQGKGGNNRLTMLPAVLIPALRRQVSQVRVQHAADLADGAGWVMLPGALAAKMAGAGRELPWQWLFPATRRCTDSATGELRRHHLHEPPYSAPLPPPSGAPN
jgi:integrase